MERVGTVVRTAQGQLVLEAASETLPVGTTVETASLETAGEVIEYFGPVEEPYVLVAPGADVTPAELVGEPLYTR